jgi:hypothetical protein
MVVGGARVRLACMLVEQSGELYTLYKAPGAGQVTGCGKVVASWKGHDRQPGPPAQENTVDRRETLLYTSPLLERIASLLSYVPHPGLICDTLVPRDGVAGVVEGVTS